MARPRPRAPEWDEEGPPPEPRPEGRLEPPRRRPPTALRTAEDPGDPEWPAVLPWRRPGTARIGAAIFSAALLVTGVLLIWTPAPWGWSVAAGALGLKAAWHARRKD